MDGLRRDKKPRSSPTPAGLNPTDELKLRPTEAEGRRARALATGRLLAGQHSSYLLIMILSAYSRILTSKM